jgi:hypothetical protein
MKFVRILAIVPLVLISLMNAGYAVGTDPRPDLAPAIAVLVLGLAGFLAAFGLARDTTWGITAALTVTGANVIGAIVALVTDTNGAIVGLVLSSLALVLVFISSPGRRKVSPA